MTMIETMSAIGALLFAIGVAIALIFGWDNGGKTNDLVTAAFIIMGLFLWFINLSWAVCNFVEWIYHLCKGQ